MPSVTQNHSLEQQLLLACLPISPDLERLTLLLEKSPDWDELHSQGQRHAVLQLIYHTLKNSPDSLVPASDLNRLQREFAAHALRSMQMQKELRRLLDLLTGAKIAVIPYKGPILGEDVYGDIALRSFVDLDLLVPPEHAQAAVQLLLEQGFWTDFELPQERWASLQKVDNQLPLYHPEQDWCVEIHWDLFHPKYVQPFDLTHHWTDLQEGKEGRLDLEETLVMLCAHGTKHFWAQLKWLVDIDRLVSCEQQMDWERALFLARHSSSTRSLLIGLNLSRFLLGTPLLDEIIERVEVDDVVLSLSENVVANLFPDDPERKQHKRKYAFYLQSRDSFGDRLKQILRWLFWPHRADWEVFRLGDRCHWFYYVQRPVRMDVKHVLRPIFIRTRDAVRLCGSVAKIRFCKGFTGTK